MILVTGGEGLVGSSIPGAGLLFTDIVDGCDERLDVTDAEQTRRVIAERKPEVIVHCAAWIDPDQCEKDPLGCYRVNVVGTMNVLEAARAVGAKLVYVSTQLIFDGQKKTPYLEDDPACGLQQYGLTHFVAEQYVRSYDNHLILRTSLCHGRCRNGRRYGFVYWVIDSLRQGKEITVVDALWTTPTGVADFGRCMRALIDRDATGTYHHSGSRFLSRYAFAVEAAQAAGLDPSGIRRIDMDQLMAKWVARRPLYAGLDSSKVEREYGIPPSDPFAGLRAPLA
ncbi:MAG: NAD(P)-dependent oxidoreductase [Planctomycetes bacterium]|nr:NAD(P)-dependent oxidoreductase [Planctomycetota bacterium]